MTFLHHELIHFRQALEAKRAELIGHRFAEGIAIERAADSIEEVMLAGERDLNVERLNRTASLLRQVGGALSRIATGEYGICLQCEEPIAEKRLKAIPWADLCLTCQETVDHEPGESAMPRRGSSISEAA